MDFTQHLTRNPETPWVATPLQLMDGSVLSIQASKTHYCHPKADLPDFTGYTHFEVMVLIAALGVDIGDLFPFMGEDDGMLAGHVPADVLQRVIDRAGGIRGLYVMDC